MNEPQERPLSSLSEKTRARIRAGIEKYWPPEERESALAAFDGLAPRPQIDLTFRCLTNEELRAAIEGRDRRE